ncbi:hypothetical protein [Arenibacter algicola]|uniref:hypothetical protein n=1 Tax=Arenibacter algicola TaxID=616991 RepID=UPI0020912008|nr:hypothetical protein [Arenibacter algicola]
MKVLVSISMSFIFLLQGVAMDMDLCSQIEKISNFVNHYQDHKEYDGDSFFDYVIEDYFNDDGDKEGHHDGPDQDNAPSHNQHQCCHPIVFVPSSNTVTIKRWFSEDNKLYNDYTSHFDSRYLESLFQPPRA